ncbi:hypothetical protein QCO44_05335 [Selenomonas sputigena]|uniref:Uncharacterized protein n=1 Tax=Selenomonas sputigena TaxID=69823 RepID=A0ABV3X4S4_9FIRM
MDKQMVEVLNNIHFAERYQALRTQYSFDLKESFATYDNSYVLAMLREIGYASVKYWRKENFFQARKKGNIYEFRYHIRIKYGIAELMWYVMKNNKYYEGDTFPNLEYELLNLENRNHLPNFRNYEDLRGILTIAFQMCEDMTAEFLKVYGDSIG